MGRKRHLKDKRPPVDPFADRRTATLKALKEYQKAGSFQENYNEVIDVLLDESDRGAIILVGGILEDVLADRIIAKLPNGQSRRSDLLRQGGVLNSFQDKLAFGLALGLIDESTLDSLDIIRQMRNACAHSMRPATLKTPAINHVFGLLLVDEQAEHIKGDVNSDYLRLTLAFIMIFHVERILGKPQAKAQAVVDRLVAKTQRYLAEAKRASSPERPSGQSEQDGPHSQKD